MLPESRFGTSPPPPSGTRVNLTLRSACVQRARMSVPEPADVMPTFLPASSFTSLIGEVGLHHQVPAVIAERGAGDVLAPFTPFLQARRDRRGRVEDAGRRRPPPSPRSLPRRRDRSSAPP